MSATRSNCPDPGETPVRATIVSQEIELADTDPADSTRTPIDAFRVKGRRLLHRIAHQEYGVVFSHCGLRVTAFDVEMNPEKTSQEDHCGRCVYKLQHG